MQLIDLEGLARKGVPYCRSQIWRKVKNKSFPAPIRLGANRMAWIESEVDAWIKERAAERDATEAA